MVKTVTTLIEANNASEIVEKLSVFDIEFPFELGIGSLPWPLEWLIWKKLMNWFVAPEAHKEAEKYTNESSTQS